MSNGALLKAAEDAGFHAILTADQGIRYQQNRTMSRVALIVLSDNDEAVLSDNVNKILNAISGVAPGDLLWVELDKSGEA